MRGNNYEMEPIKLVNDDSEKNPSSDVYISYGIVNCWMFVYTYILYIVYIYNISSLLKTYNLYWTEKKKNPFYL